MGLSKKAKERQIQMEMGKEAILSLEPPEADTRIRYGQGTFQFADLRLPKDGKLYPVVVVIHGGYWRATYDLDYVGRMCAAITSRGYATYNLEYRRVGNEGGGFPGTFLDVARGAEHIREIAPQYGLDPDRVVALGHSAGGHLALWLAARKRVPIASVLGSTDPLSLLAAISLAGVVDLRRAAELHLSSDAADELIGGSPTQFPERYAIASPIELLPLGVPQFLIHGDADDSVPADISKKYHEAAVAKGDLADLTMIPDTGHFELIDPEDDAFETVLKTIERAFAPPARA